MKNGDWRREYLMRLAKNEVGGFADLRHLLVRRLVARFLAADVEVLDATLDVRMAAELLHLPRAPKRFVGLIDGWQETHKSGVEVLRRPTGMDWRAKVGADFSVVVCMEPGLLSSLRPLAAVGRPGAYYLFRGPAKLAKRIEKDGLGVERTVGLDVDLELAGELLDPGSWRTTQRVRKLYGDDVARAVAAALLPDGSSSDALDLLFVCRDPRRSQAVDLRPPRRDPENDPQVKATRASVAAAARRRSDGRNGGRLPSKERTHNGAGRRGRPRGQGIGAFIRERILAKEAPEVTLAKVRERWPESTAKMSDWHWNRRKLVKEGMIR